MEQKRKLPIYNIAGTEFLVDVAKDELREKDNPDNKIAFDQMAYNNTHYHFRYDPVLKNIPQSFDALYEIIQVPNLTELDPAGLGQKYGKTEAEIVGKTDFDIMVDHEQLALRMKGQLPVIDIAGHPFYVDIRIGMLRPKDDFSTMGIQFRKIDEYYDEHKNHYRIPYDPKTHSIKELDYDHIKAIPKGIILVEIPSMATLDPFALATMHGINRNQVLRNIPLQMNQKAREIPWDETPIKQIIAKNLKKDLETQQSQSPAKSQRKRGRGL